MKTLVVVAHPDIRNSVINKRLVKELSKYPENYTVHNIYDHYSNRGIDVEKEHQLIEEHDKLIFQFPLFGLNCPPLMKQWLDEVFSLGRAFGSKGDKMEKKKVLLAVSAGINKVD